MASIGCRSPFLGRGTKRFSPYVTLGAVLTSPRTKRFSAVTLGVVSLSPRTKRFSDVILGAVPWY